MAYLIDGNNFLGHTSGLGPRNSDAKHGLILRLLAFQQFTRTRIYLVFDGKESSAFPDDDFKKEKFSVLHPDYGMTADGLLKDMIERRHDRRHLVLVSSDRDLRDYARERGVNTLNCREFENRLKSTLKERKKAVEMRKETAWLSPLELSLWQGAFRPKK